MREEKPVVPRGWVPLEITPSIRGQTQKHGNIRSRETLCTRRSEIVFTCEGEGRREFITLAQFSMNYGGVEVWD